MSLQTTETEDYLLCSSKCAEHPFCTAWTYHGDMRLCSLFSGEPTLLSKPVRGAVSALKNCFQQEEEEQSCFDEGIQYPLDNVVKVQELNIDPQNTREINIYVIDRNNILQQQKRLSIDILAYLLLLYKPMNGRAVSIAVCLCVCR